MQWWNTSVLLGIVFLLIILSLLTVMTTMNLMNHNVAIPVQQVRNAQLAMLFIYTSPLVLVIVLALLRTAVLGQYRETNGHDNCTSCAQACCCTPCLAAQVMRWTDGRFARRYQPVDVMVELSPHEKALQYIKNSKGATAESTNKMEERNCVVV